MDLTKLLSDGVVGGLVVCVWLLLKVLMPLVRNAIRGKRPENDVPGRVQVLEVNLSALTVQVIEFDKLLQQTSAALDDKIDIVLAELKEMRAEFSAAYRSLGERIAKAETNIEHLLSRRPAAH